MKSVVRVKRIFPIGPAADDGRLQAGDVILQVNGCKVKGLTNTEAINLLRTAPQNVTLLTCRPEDGILPPIEDLVTGIDSPFELDFRQTPKSGISDSPPESPVSSAYNESEQPRETSPTPSFSSDRESAINSQSLNTVIENPKQVQKPASVLDLTRGANTETPSTRPQSSQSEFSPSEVGSEVSVATSKRSLVARNSDMSENNKTSRAGTLSRWSSTSSLPRDSIPSNSLPCSTNTPVSSSSQQSNKTPTPVQNFIRDAGLHEYTTPSTTTASTIQEDNSWGESTPTRTRASDEQDSGPEETEEEDTLLPGEYETTLTKGDKGLGFTVAGGLNTTGYFYVKEVLYDPAKCDGRICPGDRLMKVNGSGMGGLTHKEAIAMLRQTPKTVTIRFFRELDADDSLATDSMVTPRKAPEEVEEKMPTTPADCPPPQVSVKDMIRQMENSKTMIKPHRYGVKTSLHESVRSSESGRDEDEETGKEDLVSTQSSFGDVSLPMPDEYEDELDTSHPLPSIEQGAVVRVTLIKPPSESLGFSLIQGERANSSALFVRSLTPGGVAADEGTLRVGDRILQVNGQSVIGMPHNKAVALIKKAPSKVMLAVARSRGSATQPAGSDVSSQITRSQRSSPSPSNNSSISNIQYKLPPHTTTDSDLESDTLDDEIIRNNLDPPRVQSGQLSPGQVLDDQDRSHLTTPDADNTFDSLSDEEGYHRLLAPDNDHDTSWEDRFSPFEKKNDLQDRETCVDTPSPPPTRLPSHISDSWMQNLPLVQLSPGSTLYTGSQLSAAIKQLQLHLEQDEPVEEYKSLRHAKLTDNCNIARMQENKSKNRYRNVLPYDSTRVELNGPLPDNYINASHIRMPVGSEVLHYIACQGPLPQTTGDFWRMVWEQKAQVIAMVTNDMESGKVKCHRYWPDSISTPFTVCNRYEVSLTQVQTLQDFDIHYIKMEDLETGRSHCLTHLSFSSWPDHGTPDSGQPLLQYIRFIHLVHESGPVIVHCSAGIGRTGALITVDVTIAMIEHDLKFDIHKIVLELRRQRQGMIQTKDQYIFCYKTVLEALYSLETDSRESKSK